MSAFAVWGTNFVASDAPTEPAADPLTSWVERARAGDATAFHGLYLRTRKQVHHTLYRLIGTNADMEDLVQQVYLQLLTALRAFRGDAQFSTFLYRVCANVALMHLRKRQRHPEELTDAPLDLVAGEDADPERAARLRQAAGLCALALDQLAPKKRVVFVYHELLGLMPEEIALALDVPVNTVRSRLHHARLEFAKAAAQWMDPEQRHGA